MKRKRLKSILACVLVLSMVFGVQSVAFATETDDTAVQQEVTDDTTDTADVTDKTDDTEDTDTASQDDVGTTTEGETTEPNSGIAPASVDDDIAPLSNDTMSGNCGATENDTVTWKLEQNNEDGDNPTYTLTISGNGAMADYSSGTGMPWNDYKTSITTVKIENGITTIGNRAFMGCSSLTEIEISDSVTKYGTNCFHSCTSLTSLTVGKNVSSIGQIGIYLDTAMTTLTVEEGNESYAAIGNWLYKLNDNGTASLWQTPAGAVYNLTSIQIPETITWGGKTYNVTAIGSATEDSYTLAGAKAATSITFGDDVTEIGMSAFHSCTALETMDISNVTQIGQQVFYNCTSLNNITFNDQITEIPNNFFCYCTSLTQVTLPASVSSIGRYAFANTGLTEFDIPATVTSIADYAFQTCSSLGKVTGGAGLTSLGNSVFGSCSSLKTVALTGTRDLSIPMATFGASKNPDSIESFSLENGTIAGKTFYSTDKLKSLYLGAGVTSICDYLCQNQTALEKAELIGLTSVSNQAFSGCSNLKEVIFGDSLTSIDNQAFLKCALTSVEIPDSVTTIGKYAFGSNSSLKKVRLNANLESLGEHAFNACTSLEVLDMTAVKSSDFLPTGSVMINRSNATLAIVYTASETVATAWGNKGTANTTCVAVTNGGTFADDTEFNANTLATPTKANYKFLGWYDNEDFSGTAITAAEAGKIYYAQWEEKTESTISFKENAVFNKAYNGSEYIVSTKNYEVTGSTGVVTFAYQVKDGEGWKDLTSAPVNVGEYRVKASVAEDDNYKSAETDWKEFSILKATPTYTAPTGLTATVGQTLADVTLPSGFAWQDDTATSVGTAGTHTFKVSYTPEDTNNYSVAKDIEVTITVKAKDTQKPTTDNNNNPSGTNTDKNTNTTSTDKTTSGSVQTGDTANMALWIALVALSGGLLAVTIGLKRKRKLEK